MYLGKYAGFLYNIPRHLIIKTKIGSISSSCKITHLNSEQMQILVTDIRRALQEVKSAESMSDPRHRKAAVLVPIVQSGSHLDLLLTVRTDLVEHHKNQISFPGGVADGEDSSVADTALRETFEELGIERDHIELLGELEQVTTPSGFHISPVIGYLSQIPQMQINPTEVTEVFTVPLDFFADERKLRTELRIVDGIEREVYFYDYGDRIIWGATAHMIRSLIQAVVKSRV
jgi:8-oxo-dGTP pyrophosphatase MutT (NUDIX family)